MRRPLLLHALVLAVLAAVFVAARAGEAGGSAPIILNAANEVAVAAFLQGRLKFTAIPQVIDGTLSAMVPSGVSDLQALLEVDLEARSLAEQMITDPV